MRAFHKFNIIIGGLGCLLLLAAGCKKLIAIDPPINTVGPEVVFNDPDKVTAALSEMYVLLMPNKGSSAGYVPSFGAGSTSIYAGMLGGEVYPSSGATVIDDYQFYTNKLTLTNGVVGPAFWNTPYQVIYTANECMTEIAKATNPNITDSVRNQANGECKFVRAFSYFYLSNLFGDVPMPLTAEVMASSKLTRSPVTAVVAQEEKDLLDAVRLLPANDNVGGGAKVRPNKYAAMALLARLYLYEERWQEAADMAGSLINSGYYGLTDLNNVFTDNSKEAIWQLKLTDQSVGGTPMLMEAGEFLPITSVSQSPETQEAFRDSASFSMFQLYLEPTFMMTQDLANAFEPGDKRLDHWTDSLFTPTTAPWYGATYRFVRKYPREDGLTPKAPVNYTVFRLAEQYLIRAEAYAHLNNPEGAAADINIIRQRAGLANTTANTTASLLAAVAQERRIELFAEWGHRWMDLKRTRQATTVLGAMADKQPWSDNWLVLPIPPDDIRNDPALVQNPGYTY